MEVRYVERPCLEINGGGADCGSELSVRQIVSVHSFRNVAIGNHARTVRRLEDSGGVQILHPPSVQFKLYQGEVFQYKPGTRDWVESTQTETPESALRSERGQMPTCITHFPSSQDTRRGS